MQRWNAIAGWSAAKGREKSIKWPTKNKTLRQWKKNALIDMYGVPNKIWNSKITKDKNDSKIPKT